MEFLLFSCKRLSTVAFGIHEIPAVRVHSHLGFACIRREFLCKLFTK